MGGPGRRLIGGRISVRRDDFLIPNYNVLALRRRTYTSKGYCVGKLLDQDQVNGVWVKKNCEYFFSFKVNTLPLFFHRIRFNG